MVRSSGNFVRYALGILLLIVALNAFGGGYYGLSGAEDIPTEWLEGSPFQDYFIPSLFLFFIIGGYALVTAIAVFRRHRLAGMIAYSYGIILLLWIAIQVAIIGYTSWLQPATAVAAIIILILTWQLPKQEH
ncbi:hypothetical protein [Pontibacter amylolyticus]|nr:hypothetical protein [Pontibacter amylolyticus]